MTAEIIPLKTDERPPFRRVIVESPYAGDVERNEAYARAAMLDCLRRGEAPMLSHLLYTQVLDDLDPDERSLGILAGLAWGAGAQASIFYIDYGMSSGMCYGYERAEREGRHVECRRVPDWFRPGDPLPNRYIVRLPQMVTADWPMSGHAPQGFYQDDDVMINRHGAVFIRTPSGWLGVKPDELEWISEPWAPDDGRHDPDASRVPCTCGERCWEVGRVFTCSRCHRRVPQCFGGPNSNLCDECWGSTHPAGEAK